MPAPGPAEGYLSEARSMAERGLSGFDTLHIGPLDYNVFTTADYLRTSAALLEAWAVDALRGEG